MILAATQHLGGGSESTLRASPAAGVPLSPAALRFIRSNASLYIGSVYDGHYNLSVVGQRLREAYAQLGGPSAFGAALTPSLIAQLASFYSPRLLRLTPKPPS